MANAWCINAIWYDWCYIRTLQNLDSSDIWTGVEYTAPNPLWDRNFDYIKYTDKCWNTCCLTWENEINIITTNWVLKDLNLTSNQDKIIITRTDLFWSNRAKTVVRYSTSWYPSSKTDWTLVVEETTKNQYSSTWYNLTVSDSWTYYFSAFALDSDWNVIWVAQSNIAVSLSKVLTFTLNQTQSAPWSMITAISDDAINMTQQEVIDFIWAYPVLLDNSWNEYKKLNPLNFQQFEDWTDASSYTASTSYDVMIKFPRRWYKISTTNNITTFTLTDKQNDPEYCYAPFQRLSSWTLWNSNAVYTNASAFYLWAYKWYANSNILRSRYNKTPTASQTIWTFSWYARNHWNLRWITEFMQEFYLELCFMAIYKTTDAQSSIWQWYVWWSSAPTSWTMTYNKWMTYWTSSTTQCMKFLWIENRYWWIWEWVNWRWQTSAWVHISIPTTTWDNRTSTYSYTPTWYTTVWSISPTSWSYITKVLWHTYWWFTPTTTWWSETTYFTDYARRSSGSRVARFGGRWNNGAMCGAFCWDLIYASSTSSSSIGARLMFLPNWDLSV